MWSRRFLLNRHLDQILCAAGPEHRPDAERQLSARRDFVVHRRGEFPTPRWLLSLFDLPRLRRRRSARPVKTHFDDPPPCRVVQGQFYDRPTYPPASSSTGKGRTGNTLLKHLPDGEPQPFRPEFRTGEDQDFFRRMIERGHVFAWCNEAVAYEVVPPIRWDWKFMLRRALLRGAISRVHPTCGPKAILTSALAVPIYLAVLPIALAMGRGRFMTYSIKLCDHLGRLLASIGINPIRDSYVTE